MNRKCGLCDGYGMVEQFWDAGKLQPCPTCKGDGTLRHNQIKVLDQIRSLCHNWPEWASQADTWTDSGVRTLPYTYPPFLIMSILDAVNTNRYGLAIERWNDLTHTPLSFT